MTRCNVLIVDDSRTMRSIISNALAQDPELCVVGEAGDPLEAREAIKRLNPDVVTLDIEMPKMNGLDFLERIMRLRPTPVVVISSHTERGAETTIRALELGAVDCIGKPSMKSHDSLKELAERVKSAAKAHVRVKSDQTGASRKVLEGQYTSDGRIVAIGASMGGVEALSVVLSVFPENCPPTVITQHMPPMFTRSFAERLNRTCRPTVLEAIDGAPLKSGHVYIAPGGPAHLEVSGGNPRCRLVYSDPVSGHRPSVDVLFNSVAKTAGPRSLGVILTGMGRDGAQGLLRLRETGAETIGQDEGSCLVYGMPRAAFETGAVGFQLSLNSIGNHILAATNANSKR